MLLLEANRVVSVDRIVDALWDESPPPTARLQVQFCVSALRRALTEAGAADAITTRSGGYLLRVVEDELDLQAFDRLAATGRTAAAEGRLADAAEAYGTALAMWRGPPLAEISSRVVQSAAVSLVERQPALIEESIDVRLQLGQHHELIGDLMRLTAEYPFRERLRAQLMMALYRDGRQVEALDAYRQTRDAFASELGLEPGPDLQRLELAILTGSMELESATSAPVLVERPAEAYAVPRLLPADIPDFTGRGEVLVEVRRILAPAAGSPESPSATIVSITGMGGAGKTTTAIHIAHELAPEFGDGQLYVTLCGGEARPVSPARVLERFLRALGVPGSLIPEGQEERAEMYRDRLADRRLLVVLDDAANEDQVLPLLPGGGRCAVIVTGRMRLTRLPGAHLIDLGMLDLGEAVDLLGLVAGKERTQAEPAQAASLVALCGGLPLALRITAARLAARPHWSLSQLVDRLTDERRRLDELMHGGASIRANIAVAYEGLGEQAQRLLGRLAVMDAPDFAAWVGGPLLDIGLGEAEDLLESLVDVQLVAVERVAGGEPRYRFHDLVRVYAREQLAGTESDEESRAALRRLLGCWLWLAREAHRREYGGDYTVLHGTAERFPLPEPVTGNLLAVPLDWYEIERVALVAAVRQAAAEGFDEACWDLAMTTVALFEAHSYLDDWRDTHEVALAATRRGRNRRGEAAMLYSLGALSLVERRFDESDGRLERAFQIFDGLGDTHGCGLALRNLAYLDRVRGNFDGALSRYKQALAALREAGDAIGEAHVLSNIAHIHLEREQYEQATELLANALEIVRVAGARRVETQILHRLAESFLRRDDLQRADEAFRSVLVMVRTLGDQTGEAYCLYGLGLVQSRLAQYCKAEPILRQALRIAVKHGEHLLTGQLYLALAEVCRSTDRLDEALAGLTQARRLFEELGTALWLKRVLVLLGEVRSAATEPACQRP
jgi:DNA-binding SARP family transcriptional activator